MAEKNKKDVLKKCTLIEYVRNLKTLNPDGVLNDDMPLGTVMKTLSGKELIFIGKGVFSNSKDPYYNFICKNGSTPKMYDKWGLAYDLCEITSYMTYSVSIIMNSVIASASHEFTYNDVFTMTERKEELEKIARRLMREIAECQYTIDCTNKMLNEVNEEIKEVEQQIKEID